MTEGKNCPYGSLLSTSRKPSSNLVSNAGREPQTIILVWVPIGWAQEEALTDTIYTSLTVLIFHFFNNNLLNIYHVQGFKEYKDILNTALELKE